MNSKSSVTPIVYSIVIGALLFAFACILTSKREPWDSASYWALIYPLIIASSAYLGYNYPDRPWRWPLILFETQFVAMAIRNGELGNLWPMGMVLFAIIAIPAIVVANLVARRKLRIS